jgi:TFIIF-interacting CTD phosphatase-like protein
VLDLDNTLIHSVKKEPSNEDPTNSYFKIKDYSKPIIENSKPENSKIEEKSSNLVRSYEPIYVFKRPFLDNFLSELTKIAEVHCFTASTRDYAEQILNQLDPTATIFTKRFFREVINFFS